jgi:predicted GH43/DUF377 family glycosyl hydrolase
MTLKLKRYEKNPILKPNPENPWESIIVFNTAAILLDNKIHLLYRARGCTGGVSRIGYASTKDGFNIDERIDKPIYTVSPDSDIDCLGVEDPRIVQIDDMLYMTYSAYGFVPGMYRNQKWVQLAITSISVKDFLNKKWNWSKPLYPFLNTDNKDAALFPEKINGKYVLMHRIPQQIWLGYSRDMHNFQDNSIIMQPQGYGWEYFKIGGGGTPIKTEKGWIIIYHAVDNKMVYRLGLAVLDLKDPRKVIYRHPEPILEPEEEFEKVGDVSNVVFTLFVYYGAADTVICVATAELKEILTLF